MTSPYDMSDYHALIRGIREIDRSGQNSTLARLITADWLEDRGEAERATFIRNEIACERHAATLACPEYSSIIRKLVEESNRLAGRTVDDLQGRLPAWSAPARRHNFPCHTMYTGAAAEELIDWRAGFVSRVECPLTWWIAHGPDLCRRHPVKEVVVTDAVPNNYLLCVQYADGTNSSRPQWAWLEQTEAEWLPGDRDDIVPIQFVPFLDGRRGENPRWRNYDAGADARAAYNTAALRWAEAEADRPRHG